MACTAKFLPAPLLPDVGNRHLVSQRPQGALLARQQAHAQAYFKSLCNPHKTLVLPWTSFRHSPDVAECMTMMGPHLREGVLLSGAGTWLCPMSQLHPSLRPLMSVFGEAEEENREAQGQTQLLMILQGLTTRMLKSGAYKSYAAEGVQWPGTPSAGSAQGSCTHQSLGISSKAYSNTCSSPWSNTCHSVCHLPFPELPL